MLSWDSSRDSSFISIGWCSPRAEEGLFCASVANSELLEVSCRSSLAPSWRIVVSLVPCEVGPGEVDDGGVADMGRHLWMERD